MKAFKELKQLIIESKKEDNACETGYLSDLGIENKADLLKVITDNWAWLFQDVKIINIAFLEENFSTNELKKANIYTKGTHKVRTNSFACGDAIIKSFGNSIVMACDKSEVIAYGNSNVFSYGNSIVRAYGTSIVRASDNSFVKSDYNSTVYAYDHSSVHAYGNSIVRAYGSSMVNAYDDSYVEDWHGGILPKSDFTIVKDCRLQNIYVKDGGFKISEINL